MFRVKYGQIQSQSGEKTTFEKTEQEPARHQSPIVLHQAGESGNDTPRCGNKRYPTRGPHFLDDEIRREFDNQVGYKEQGDRGLEL